MIRNANHFCQITHFHFKSDPIQFQLSRLLINFKWNENKAYLYTQAVKKQHILFVEMQ